MKKIPPFLKKRQNISILFVDDEPYMLELGPKILKITGYIDITTAINADAAIKHLERREFDALITDVIMPGTSCDELVRYALERYPQMPIILASGYSLDGLASEIKDQGCKAFLQKPFNIQELISVLDHYTIRNKSPKPKNKQFFIEQYHKLKRQNEELINESCTSVSSLDFKQRIANAYPYIIGGLVHDMNNTLSVIVGHLTVVHYEANLSNLYRKDLELAIKATERQGMFLKYIGELSRQFYLAEHRMQSSCNLVNVIKKIRSKASIDRDKFRLLTSGIKLIPILRIPEMVLSQIILEMIRNCQKLSEGMSHILTQKIEFSYLSKSHTLRIVSKDNGPGFPKNVLESQPSFLRADGKISGLYFLSHIVQRIGGNMAIANNKKGGAITSIIIGELYDEN